MNTLIRLEETALFIFSYLLSLILGFKWWIFPVFLFVPDISMLGYLFGNKTGAWIYNIIHFRFLGIAMGVLGYFIDNQVIIMSGIILFAHSTLDRIFGYGLKYESGFNQTHLGEIGKN